MSIRRALNVLHQSTQTAILPTQLIFGAVVLKAEAVGLARPLFPSHILLIRAWRDNGFPPALPTQSVRAGTEEQSEAVLLWHALQEAPQGFVAFLAVTAVVRDCCSLGAGYNIFWPQGATFLVQATVLGSLQALVLTIHSIRGSWGEGFRRKIEQCIPRKIKNGISI